MNDEFSAVYWAIVLVWLTAGVVCLLLSMLPNPLLAIIFMIAVTYVLVKLGIRLYKGGY